MNLQLFATLKNYNFKNLPRDIFSGIIIAAVSIPISMGYAQISGIPAIYGLYGSVFPILFFALFSTSKQFIFGVDAAPAAIVGSALSTLGIAVESPDAMKYVPMIALFAGLWLLLFYFLHADRIVDFHTSHGRVHQWHLAYDHFYADSQTYGKFCRFRRDPGTAYTYFSRCQNYKLVLSWHGDRRAASDPYF